ncbi:MAG: hypothetical protein LBJ63_05740 [Prevotellaceae bacterium]|jgi:hypothetical protein|nr:hypothetical protein [Prevotellaceae bacterium]
MKKVILLIGCLSLLTAGIISVSCSKDDEWKGCKCTLTYAGETETETASAEELKAEGINSCSQAQKLMETVFEDDEDFESVKCVDL